MKTTPIILSLVTNGVETKQESMIVSIDSNTPSCNCTIYIDVDAISPSRLADWKLRNKDYLTKPESTDPSIITIDASMIDKADFYTWLVHNQDYISYNRTSGYIACMHTIKDLDDLDTVRQTAVHSTLTLGEIKAQIIAKKGDFDKENYDKYLRFYDNGGQIAIDLIHFELKKNCFSFPLLRKIVSKGLTDDSIFKFRLVDLDNSGYLSMVIEVEYTVESEVGATTTIPEYYNFSHIPGIINYEYELNAL